LILTFIKLKTQIITLCSNTYSYSIKGADFYPNQTKNSQFNDLSNSQVHGKVRITFE